MEPRVPASMRITADGSLYNKPQNKDVATHVLVTIKAPLFGSTGLHSSSTGSCATASTHTDFSEESPSVSCRNTPQASVWPYQLGRPTDTVIDSKEDIKGLEDTQAEQGGLEDDMVFADALLQRQSRPRTNSDLKGGYCHGSLLP